MARQKKAASAKSSKAPQTGKGESAGAASENPAGSTSAATTKQHSRRKSGGTTTSKATMQSEATEYTSGRSTTSRRLRHQSDPVPSSDREEHRNAEDEEALPSGDVSMTAAQADSESADPFGKVADQGRSFAWTSSNPVAVEDPSSGTRSQPNQEETESINVNFNDIDAE
ncbi:hypothetical protein FRC07_009451, partial [Ceratobasidium sp. 392]